MRAAEAAAAIEKARTEAAHRIEALDEARTQTLARAERAEAQLDELLAETRRKLLLDLIARQGFATLDELVRSLSTILQVNYFFTRAMEKRLGNRSFNTVTGVLLLTPASLRSRA